ncbi:transferase [Lithospermum erythrorhizon]|uniref:holo-[acyl-carrier-protein] synthase n=1 Tax=Lithospermum erythrorhizon TaxID=34254 RepID=A0AAV3Q4B3_LITER
MKKATIMMRTQCCTTQKFFCTSPPYLTPQQLPQPMETHLWYMIPNEVKDQKLINRYLEILSPCEKDSIFRMCDEELRKRAILARALVRTTIARYQINSQPLISPRSLKFRKNAYGKPEVYWEQNDECHPPPLHFNMSHTSSLIACGVSSRFPIGIDVEDKHRVTKHSVSSFAKRYLTEHEIQFLTSFKDPIVQQQEFIKLWTLKEAYVKALGKGFSGAPFKTFTISSGHYSDARNSSSKASNIRVDSANDPINCTTNWQFILLELHSSHYAAICTGNDCPAEGERSNSMKVTVRKTIPFCEDRDVSETGAMAVLSGLT